MWYRICHFPISYDLINSCQVRDKFSSTKLLGTKFSWNRYFVWDIPLWIFQKTTNLIYPDMKFWLGKKELYSLSFISLWSLSTCSDRACHTNFPRICSVFSKICCFKFGQMESSWLPFFIHLRKAQKAKTGFKCPNTTQDVRLWPLKIQREKVPNLLQIPYPFLKMINVQIFWSDKSTSWSVWPS